MSLPEWVVVMAAGGLVGLLFAGIFVLFLRRCFPPESGRAREARARARLVFERVAQGGAPANPAELADLREHRRTAYDELLSLAVRLDAPSAIRLQPLYQALDFLVSSTRNLESRSWYRRARAAAEIGLLRYSGYVPTLTDLLDDPVTEVRAAALVALCRIGSPAPLAPIFGAIYAAGRWTSCRLRHILSSFAGTAGPEGLRIAKESPSREARLVAIEALGLLKVGEAVPVLRQTLWSPDTEDRIRSARALGRIGDAEATDDVLRALVDPVWQVRAAAAVALGELGAQEAVEALERSLMDPAWWVRHNSAEALARLGAEGAAGLRRSLGHADAFARDTAAQMLDTLRFRENQA